MNRIFRICTLLLSRLIHLVNLVNLSTFGLFSQPLYYPRKLASSAFYLQALLGIIKFGVYHEAAPGFPETASSITFSVFAEGGGQEATS